MSITKAQINFIKGLSDKKNRASQNLFVIEGPKIIIEIIEKGIIPQQVWATEKYFSSIKNVFISVEPISGLNLEKIAQQKNPAGALALVKISDLEGHVLKRKKTGISLFLDTIQDPGNLGTIIRSADWFGCEAVICSSKTVDFLNYKVVQASMGSVFNIPVLYVEPESWLKEKVNLGFNLYATHLQGEDLFPIMPKLPAIIMVGNESKGLAASLSKYSKKLIKIPSYGSAESLNAAVACSIVLADFRRKI